MDMDSVSWWINVAAMAIACTTDIRSRRIPNWLVLPFLISGILMQIAESGMAGAARSFTGIVVATAFYAAPCLLGAMGMGDFKLACASGAWLGPGPMVTAFIVTSIAGGVLALAYSWRKGTLDTSFVRTGALVSDLARLRVRRPEYPSPVEAATASIPYAPAIAIGTLFAFFAR